MLLLSAAMALARATDLLTSRGWIQAAEVVTPDLLHELKPLAGVLPAFVAFFCYSEAAVFDPVTRSLTGHPIAWDISSYQGVSDGRNEFVGYFENRRDVR